METADDSGDVGSSTADNPWAAPACDLSPQSASPRVRHPFAVLAEGAAIGTVLGLADIYVANELSLTATNVIRWASVVAAVLLGLRHGNRAWLAWPWLAVLLALINLLAIAGGYREQYFESNEEAAVCLIWLLPTGLAAYFGVFLGWAYRAGVRRLARR